METHKKCSENCGCSSRLECKYADAKKHNITVTCILDSLMELGAGLDSPPIELINSLQEQAAQSEEYHAMPPEMQREMIILCNTLRRLFTFEQDLSDKIGNEYMLIVAPVEDVKQYLDTQEKAISLFQQSNLN